MAETGMASDASRPRVYISYAREDAAFAGRLALVLGDRGFEAVIDREDLDADEMWKARVRPLIVSSDQMVVILTANSVALPSVRWEAELAAASGKRIVVVVPAPLDDGIALSPPLSTSPWFHFYQHPTRSDSGIYAGPALENALKADLPWRRQYTSLFLLAEQWKDRHGADELLLRGDTLNDALSWRASIPRGQMLVLAVADFLEASEQAEAHRVVPAGEFESRLRHLEERRAAATEAVRAKAAAAQAKREEAAPAPLRMLTPTQLANVPLAPVQTLASPEPQEVEDEVANASRDEVFSGRETRRAKKGLVAPALIALLMFAGAGAVVWQVVPQYLASPMRAAVANTPETAAASSVAAPSAADPIEAEVAPVAPSDPAPIAPLVSPQPAPPAQAAQPRAPEPAAAEPAAAGVSPEEADWLAAREIGNIAAFRTYMLKWPEGRRYGQALSAVRRRIETLSAKPESNSIVLPGQVTYRELPTFRDKGVAGGAAGQAVSFMDRIASPREGEWLVIEQEGAWPFRFISAREIDAAKQ